MKKRKSTQQVQEHPASVNGKPKVLPHQIPFETPVSFQVQNAKAPKKIAPQQDLNIKSESPSTNYKASIPSQFHDALSGGLIPTPTLLNCKRDAECDKYFTPQKNIGSSIFNECNNQVTKEIEGTIQAIELIRAPLGRFFAARLLSAKGRKETEIISEFVGEVIEIFKEVGIIPVVGFPSA